MRIELTAINAGFEDEVDEPLETHRAEYLRFRKRLIRMRQQCVPLVQTISRC